METAWPTQISWAALQLGVWAAGTPNVYAFNEVLAGPDGKNADTLKVIAKADGTVLAAIKLHDADVCGGMNLAFSNSGKLGLQLWADIGTDNLFYDMAPSDVGKLFAAPPAAPTFTWEHSLVGHSVPQFISFDEDILAVDFFHVAIGIPATGEQFYADELPGAPSGEWMEAHVGGGAVFVGRFDYERIEWYVYEKHQLTHFLGTVDRDISQLTTNGETLVWVEGHDPVTQPDGTVAYDHYGIYAAPFTTDPAMLKPRLLVPNVARNLSWLRIANGLVSGIYEVRQKPVRETAALVVRLSDGRAWVSDLPDNMNWSERTFPGTTELWGGITPSPNIQYAQTLARIPYSSMTLRQAAAPDPNGGAGDAGITDGGAD